MPPRPSLDHDRLTQEIVVIAAQAGAITMEVFNSVF
jgi:hypothetical protein